MTTDSKKLNHYIFLQWLGFGTLASILSISVVILVAWTGYRLERKNTINELLQKSTTASRRLEAEYLLKEHGEISSTKSLLSKELNVSVSTTDKKPDLCTFITSDTCSRYFKNSIEVVRYIPSQTSQYVVLKRSVYFKPHISFNLFLFSILPIFIIFTAGFLFQRYFLSRFIITPITSIVHLVESRISIPDDWPLEFHKIAKKMESAFSLKEQAAFSKLASQVAHDIRSPLTALDMALNDLSHLPEENRILIRKASQRIHDISNNLLNRRRLEGPKGEFLVNTNEAPTIQLISAIVDPLISEKRLQYRSRMNIEIESILGASSYGLFSNVNAAELSRVLSNLINNSQEAIKHSGHIVVGLEKYNEEHLVLFVQDNGHGIPDEVINKLGTTEFSSGKSGGESGAGLGVYHARTTIEKWGGELKIENLEQGAKFSIILPIAQPPSWFVPFIKTSDIEKIVVLDDDISIHKTWDERFKPSITSKKIQLIHLSSPNEFKAWVKLNGKEEVLFLCDYELTGFNQTGLDLIEELSIQHQSILVSSRFSENAVRIRCEKANIKGLPKELAGIVPIQLISPSRSIDAVLIDDDDLVHMSWQLGAKETGKTINTFHSPKVFLEKSLTISKQTPIYIDSNLGAGIKGEAIAKDIFDMGYKEIYLCTGEQKSAELQRPYIRDIVGKEFPNL